MESYPQKFNLLHLLLYNNGETERQNVDTYGGLQYFKWPKRDKRFFVCLCSFGNNSYQE